MFTGADNILNVGQISEWNFSPSINSEIYPDYCGQLNGSAGEFFPPGRGKDYVDFFTPDLCRYSNSALFDNDFQIHTVGFLEGQ